MCDISKVLFVLNKLLLIPNLSTHFTFYYKSQLEIIYMLWRSHWFENLTHKKNIVTVNFLLLSRMLIYPPAPPSTDLQHPNEQLVSLSSPDSWCWSFCSTLSNTCGIMTLEQWSEVFLICRCVLKKRKTTNYNSVVQRWGTFCILL